MPYKYNPPTRTSCKVCEAISKEMGPKISTQDGKASSADNYPFHNWYNFVLGYSPEFPYYLIRKWNIHKKQLVVDPFMGSGTTLVCCKTLEIPSAGIDANDFFEQVSKIKLNWNINTTLLQKIFEDLLSKITSELNKYNWCIPGSNSQQQMPFDKDKLNYLEYLKGKRPALMVEKYISDIPFAKLSLINDLVSGYKFPNKNIKDIFLLAVSSIILPSSNIRYGPGFGVVKPKIDIDVLKLFRDKVQRMIDDLTSVDNNQKDTNSKTILGDARKMSSYFKEGSIDYLITSPPYPGDHEYTKHSRLELIFTGFATNLAEFRIIKKRMLAGSTTNIYKEDKAGELIKDIKSIETIAKEIEKRIKIDGGTSGFEKLYSKLVREYFGGMYLVFCEAHKVLKSGGKFSLLVSDSHAFKMVHIKTADLLAEVAEKAGFKKSDIELWQYKNSTSHKYKLFENILTVQK